MFDTPANCLAASLMHHARYNGTYLFVRADYECDGMKRLAFIHLRPFIKLIGSILEFPAIDVPENYQQLIGNIIQDAKTEAYGTYTITYFPNHNVTDQMSSIIEIFNDEFRD